MSDKFSVIPSEHLLHWILAEEKSGQIFGVHQELFFKPSPGDPFKMKRFGKTLETPLGVAAGPHTQMAQNIITAWLCGARYIELKTIQTLDELEVSKPCIDMEDEGYNCEWSQELRLEESFNEYLKAWILIHILRHRFGWESASSHSPGFIFNMSVGYNMEGILKENVQHFLAKMENCKKEKEEQIHRIAHLYPQVNDLDIPDRLSDNITLSTMHGCPPEEIEKIALYFLEEKKYHTTVKLNPTLLGPGEVRRILHEKLGFDTIVPDDAFAHDLKYPDAVKMIQRLKKHAAAAGVEFGLKLTNTLECVNHRSIFPGKEKMMYLSGRPLHPLSINLAAKLQTSFNGGLDISFCAGVDCFNIVDVIACGLKPVTVCSDLLKPGGYARLPQYLEKLSAFSLRRPGGSFEKPPPCFHGPPQNFLFEYGSKGKFGLESADESEPTSIGSLRRRAPGPPQNFLYLKKYAARVIDNNTYKKSFFPGKSIKTGRPLGYFDCIEAPCVTTCPTHQDVPGYMLHTAQGNYKKALEVILKENPFPAVTGNVCHHPCITKCTRLNYDNPLQIRAIKGFASHCRKKEPGLIPAPKNDLKAAVIGAGPSGLSCAFFLALAGFAVAVYETQKIPGGMLAQVIPHFRLKDEDIKKDLRRIERLGVKIHYNTRIDKTLFQELEKEADFIYIAVGAQKSTPMNIKGENLPGVMDALTFLTSARKGKPVPVGPKVTVIGGGNSAMDAARAALRQVRNTDGGEVTLLYRRTREQMPAAPEEIEAAIAEGIKIVELTTPVEIEQENHRLKVRCWKMRLGEKDETGRRRPIKIENSDFALYFDTVITAVGQTVVLDFLADREWLPIKQTGETAIKNVFIGGDALRGPSTIIEAVADGKKAARYILSRLSVPPAAKKETTAKKIEELNLAAYQKKSARRIYGEDRLEMTGETAQKEAQRCLLCSHICNVCVTVCPNRANVSYMAEPREYLLQKAVNHGGKLEIIEDEPLILQQKYQVFNIANFCNECGNCRTFCPSSGAPYQDKPKICLSPESFQQESRAFFIGTEQGKRFIKSKKENGEIETLVAEADHYAYETPGFSAQLDKATLRVKDLKLKNSALKEVNFKGAVEMSILYNSIIHRADDSLFGQ
jgi:putative selenate reductase